MTIEKHYNDVLEAYCAGQTLKVKKLLAQDIPLLEPIQLNTNKAPTSLDYLLFYTHTPTQHALERRVLSQLGSHIRQAHPYYHSYSHQVLFPPREFSLLPDKNCLTAKWLDLLFGSPISYRQYPNSCLARKAFLKEVLALCLQSQEETLRLGLKNAVPVIPPKTCLQYSLPLINHILTAYPRLEPDTQLHRALFDITRGDLALLLLNYCLLYTQRHPQPNPDLIKDYLLQLRLSEFTLQPAKVLCVLKAMLPRHNVVHVLSNSLLTLFEHTGIPLHEGLNQILDKKVGP